MFLFVLAVFALLLCLEPSAYAWGPGAHLEYCTEVLKHTAILSPAIGQLLKRHVKDYLYGALAADIILGKKYTHERYHCHNWSVGFHLLEEARNDPQRAFCLGYLSHLAADTVSHNYFVPYSLVYSFSAKTLKHAYWEVRFDAYMDREMWALTRKIMAEDFSEHDRHLDDNLSMTLFSFGTNKKIFNGLMLLSYFDKWRFLVDKVVSNSAWEMTQTDIREYKALAVNQILQFLVDMKGARCLNADPTGEDAQKAAALISKGLRRLRRAEDLREADLRRALPVLRERFKEGICCRLTAEELIRDCEKAIGKSLLI